MSTIYRTYTGKMVDLANPRVEDIDLKHIVMSLARCARFNGSSLMPYNNSKHSLLAEYCTLDPLIKPYSFVHDFHEAYLGDVLPMTAEACGATGQLDLLKLKWDKVIWKAFELEEPSPYTKRMVNFADRMAFVTEWEHAMGTEKLPGYDDVEPLSYDEFTKGIHRSFHKVAVKLLPKTPE